MRDIGKNIKDLRISKDLTQDELAEKLFVTRQTVSNYETGRTRPDIDSLMKISEVLEADIHTVLYGDDKSKEKEKMMKILFICIGISLLLLVLTFYLAKSAYEIKTMQYKTMPTFYVNILLKPFVAAFISYTVMQLFGTFFKLSRFSKKHKLAVIIIVCILIVLYIGLFSPLIFQLNIQMPYMFMITFLGANPNFLQIPFHLIFGVVIGVLLWLCEIPKFSK